MNLLFLYRIYPNYGGVEVVTTTLANQFVNDGHEVSIVSFEQPHMELAYQLSENIELFKLDYPIVTRKNINQLHAIVIKKKISLIINQWGLPFQTTLLCHKAIQGTACEMVSVLHGSPYTSKIILKAQDRISNANNFLSRIFYQNLLWVKENIIKSSIRYNCRKNAKYILLSESFIEPLVRYASLRDTSNVLAIGNPITIPIEKKTFDPLLKKKQLLYVGRMDYENKRVNRIVEVWEDLYKEFKDWELVLVGDGPHKEILQEYVASHSIKRVRFEGFQVDPPVRYYKEASIFLLTSDLEGFGLVITESMSYGVVPIVYGSYEAIYDIIQHGKSGFITDKPYQKENTIEYLRLLMNNSELRCNMAKNAIVDSSKFTVESIAEKWYQLFNSCCRK